MMIVRTGLVGLLAATVIFALASRASAADQPETVIVALGDSLTAGYGLPQSQSFPAQLQAALKAKGQNVRIVNAGVSGDTASAAAKRLDWALPDNAAAVIVELGGNDALRGIDPALTEANLDEILTRLSQRGLPVLVAGMLAPPNLGREFGDAFNAVFPAVAKRHKVPLYPFFLDGVAGKPALNLDDGMHPNAAGVAVIVKRITPYVLRVLGETR